MLTECRDLGITGLTASELLTRHGREIRAQYISSCKRTGQIADPSASWSVITGAGDEMGRAIRSFEGLDAAFAELSISDITSVIRWFKSEARADRNDQAVGQAVPDRPRPVSTAHLRQGEISHRWIIKGDSNHVEAWSDFRLPFEPKGDQRQYLAELRKALMKIEPAEEKILRGQYTALSKPINCDPENVIFYNVGEAAIWCLSRRGLMFEYCEAGPPPDPHGEGLQHYCRYELVPAGDGFRCCRFDEEVTEIANFEIKSRGDFSTPGMVWRRIQESWDAAQMEHRPRKVKTKFALDVELSGDADGLRSLAAYLKPVFDGTCAACHVFRQRPDQSLVAKIADQIDVDVASVGRWLTRPGPALISEESPVKDYGSRISWHPEDERCAAGAFRQRIDESLTIRISVKLLIGQES